MDLRYLNVFLEVAERRSFSAAASCLKMTTAAVSKQIMTLEDQIGVKLFHRTTRLVSLTEEGIVYHERIQSAVEEVQEATAQVQELKASPRGLLRVSAPSSFGQMRLLPALVGFAKTYPQIHMDVSLEDRHVDVIAERFDLVVRIGALVDSTLKVKRLMDCPIDLVASPAYLKAHGTPKTPDDLKHHRWISYSLNRSGSETWEYISDKGKRGVLNIKAQTVFTTDTANLLRQAAVEGIGLVLLPRFASEAFLETGELVPLLPDYKTYPPRSVYALMPPNQYRSTKVKLLLEWLEKGCRSYNEIVKGSL